MTFTGDSVSSANSESDSVLSSSLASVPVDDGGSGPIGGGSVLLGAGWLFRTAVLRFFLFVGGDLERPVESKNED